MVRGAGRAGGRPRPPAAFRWAATLALTFASIASSNAAAPPGWRAWSLGYISLAAPANWRPPEAEKPSPLHLGGDEWFFTLAEQPNDVEKGALLNVAWSDDGSIYSAGAKPSQIVSSQAAELAGLAADRIEFAVRDRYNDSAGVDVVVKQPLSGRMLTLTCRAPRAEWRSLQPVCEQIVSTVALNVATTASPPTPTPGRSPVTTEPTPNTVAGEQPPATPILRLEAQNTEAVVNGPRAETSFTLKAPVYLRTVSTYHWNEGRGAAPGTMSLSDAGGATLGPWRARGESGQGGAPNVNWVAEVNQRLEPGRYVLQTSDDQSWSTNEKRGWKGFYTIEYQLYPAIAQSTPTPQSTATPPNPPPPVKTAWTPPPAHESLFAGSLDAGWEKVEVAGGDFANFAHQEQGALVVDAPAGHSWGRTGLVTAPANWLFFDNFAGEARQTFTFRFDPARTHGFVAAVVSDRDWCVKGGQPPGVAVVFAPKADGQGSNASLADLAANGERRASVDVAATGVAELVIVMTPGNASATVDGVKLAEGKIKGMENASGYAVCVYTQGRDVNLPGSFALREITVDRVEGAPQKEPQLASGVEQFPVVTLLGPKATVQWETTGVNGGEFAKFGKVVDGAVVVDVPKGDGWRNTGVLSKTPAITVDSFAAEAPYRFVFKFDPRATTDFVVQMMTPRTWDWHYQRVWFGINRRFGQLFFFLKYCPGADALRLMPHQWNGDVEATVHEGWAEVGVPGAFHMRCDASGVGLNTELFAGILSAPDKEGAPAAFSLRSLTVQRIPPDGMTNAQRWRYVDDKSFDAKSFLSELDQDLSALGDAKSEPPNAK